MANGYRHTGSSVTGSWYAAHVYEGPAGFVALLCLGSGGPILGFGEVRTAVAVESYSEAIALGDRFCRACGAWRRGVR